MSQWLIESLTFQSSVSKRNPPLKSFGSIKWWQQHYFEGGWERGSWIAKGNDERVKSGTQVGKKSCGDWKKTMRKEIRIKINPAYSSDFETGTPFSRSPHPPKMTKLAQDFKVTLAKFLCFTGLMFLLFYSLYVPSFRQWVWTLVSLLLPQRGCMTT